MNRFLSTLLRPLCWIGWHPMRSRASSAHAKRCDVCGRFVEGGA